MQMQIRLKRWFGSFVLVLACFLNAQLAVGQSGVNKGEPLVILAEMQNHKIAYKVDGKEALPDLLRVLNIIGEQRGHDIPITVLIDYRAPISEIGNIEGTLDKAEFSKARFFIFNREANVMSTVAFGRTTPFSTRPPWN